jgi:hypothetical protein
MADLRLDEHTIGDEPHPNLSVGEIVSTKGEM